MSQAKVEKYKEQKANRKQTMKKEKIQRIVRNSIAAVVVVAALGWVGYSGVTSIGYQAFRFCGGLTEIVCHAPTAPTIDSYTFQNIKTGGVLKVPVSSDYSTWMSTSSYYLGYYNWTMENI